MFERIMHSNEIISFTVMLLMVLALVASQADARIQQESEAAATMEQTLSGKAEAPFRATIEAQFNGIPLTISIDAMAEFDLLRLGHQ